jgi:hypothetical integral membrane protein (TIGR02206 family)
MSEEWIRNTFFSAVIIFVLLVGSSYLKKQVNIYITYIMGIALFVSSITSPLRTYLAGNFSIAVDLPFHLCGISAFICSVMPFLKNKQRLFDFVFYTGIIGGIMGILTPQMSDYDGSFYVYFVFYMRHILIFTMPIYMLRNLGLSLTKKSMVRTFVILNILLAFIMPFNFIVGGNYMYLAEPPQVNNPLIIGEWPYYVIWFEVFVILLLLLLYYLSKISFRKSKTKLV